eukprot:SAG31_NODE_14452_length_805_cov_4.885269_1_plen_162_part_10
MLRDLLLPAVLATVTASSSAQPAGEPSGGLPLFPAGQEVPGERNGTTFRETWSGKYGGSFYSVAVPALYGRLVPNASTVVVVSPGGAYTHLSWVLEGESAARWLNALNVSVYILKYRVPLRPWLPFGEAPLIDVQRAMGLVRSWHPNASVGVLGFSAGSHLS